jgi:protein-tyrosine phosphatase
MSVGPLDDYNRLPLQTLYNVRDLGGIPTLDGRLTVFGRYIRADAPVRLNPEDLQRLLDYPVRTIIDLRSADEHVRTTHGLQDQPVVDYYNIPLAGDNLDAAMAAVRPFETGREGVDLADFYVYLLEYAQQQIGRVFERLALARPGAVLFHCSHGKDRTGLVSALILLLANVGDPQIIDNYSISYRLLKPWFDTFIHKVPADFLPFYNTNPANMARTLAFFHSRYPSAAAYLAGCGLPEDEIAAVRQRILVE